MHLDWMLSQAKKFNSAHYTENVAVRAIITELEDIQLELSRKELIMQKEQKVIQEGIEACCLIKPSNQSKYNSFISELKAHTADSRLSLLVIAVRRIKELIHE
jgi:glutamate dehydrogenase